jgi:hypothetical protein
MLGAVPLFEEPIPGLGQCKDFHDKLSVVPGGHVALSMRSGVLTLLAVLRR